MLLWNVRLTDSYTASPKPEYAWVKAGIINQPEMVRPTHENWIKDKVKWATINVAESYEESSPR